MDDAPNSPIHFGNKVIRLLVDHLLGEDMIVLPADFETVRAAFKQGGGSWERVVKGNIEAVKLLEKLVVAWGGGKDRIRKTELI